MGRRKAEKAGYNRVTRENSEEVEMQLNPFEHHEQDYEEETDSPHGYMGEDLEEETTRKEFRPCSHTMEVCLWCLVSIIVIFMLGKLFLPRVSSTTPTSTGFNESDQLPNLSSLNSTATLILNLISKMIDGQKHEFSKLSRFNMKASAQLMEMSDRTGQMSRLESSMSNVLNELVSDQVDRSSSFSISSKSSEPSEEMKEALVNLADGIDDIQSVVHLMQSRQNAQTSPFLPSMGQTSTRIQDSTPSDISDDLSELARNMIEMKSAIDLIQMQTSHQPLPEISILANISRGIDQLQTILQPREIETMLPTHQNIPVDTGKVDTNSIGASSFQRLIQYQTQQNDAVLLNQFSILTNISDAISDLSELIQSKSEDQSHSFTPHVMEAQFSPPIGQFISDQNPNRSPFLSSNFSTEDQSFPRLNEGKTTTDVEDGHVLAQILDEIAVLRSSVESRTDRNLPINDFEILTNISQNILKIERLVVQGGSFLALEEKIGNLEGNMRQAFIEFQKTTSDIPSSASQLPDVSSPNEFPSKCDDLSVSCDDNTPKFVTFAVGAGKYSTMQLQRGLRVMYSSLVKSHKCSPKLHVYTDLLDHQRQGLSFQYTTMGTVPNIEIHDMVMDYVTQNVFSQYSSPGQHVNGEWGGLSRAEWSGLSRAKLDHLALHLPGNAVWIDTNTLMFQNIIPNLSPDMRNWVSGYKHGLRNLPKSNNDYRYSNTQIEPRNDVVGDIFSFDERGVSAIQHFESTIARMNRLPESGLPGIISMMLQQDAFSKLQIIQDVQPYSFGFSCTQYQETSRKLLNWFVDVFGNNLVCENQGSKQLVGILSLTSSSFYDIFGKEDQFDFGFFEQEKVQDFFDKFFFTCE